MKIPILLLALFSQISVFGKKQYYNDSLKVLFVGNSLTYYNDMPQLLQQMLREDEKKIKIEQSTFPGVSLETHLKWMDSYGEANGIDRKNGNIFLTKQILNQSKWDYVILQEGTVRYLIPDYVKKNLRTTISEIIRLFHNEETQFILFQTWTPTNYYPQTYCHPKRLPVNYNSKIEEICSPIIQNKNQEIEIIKKSCEELAAFNKMTLSKNGELFYKFNLQFPELKLYDDEGHPTKAGAFMNACVFYELFTNKKAKDLLFASNLELKTAVLIRNFVTKNNF